ncbi:MAG: transketolase C-terminal domain-containing protein, partial [Terriglobales bacterium]
SGNDVITVVAAGVTLPEALKAYDELKKDGIAIRVVDLFSVRPVDAKTLLACAQATQNTILTVEDHYLAGGIGDAVAEAVGGQGVRVLRLGIQQIPHSGTAEQLLHAYKIDAAAISEQARALAPAAAAR